MLTVVHALSCTAHLLYYQLSVTLRQVVCTTSVSSTELLTFPTIRLSTSCEADRIRPRAVYSDHTIIIEA